MRAIAWTITLFVAAFALPLAAQTTKSLGPSAPPAPVVQAAAAAKGVAVAAVPTPAAPALTKADVDAWLDGFVPQALAQNDIAGGVVVVVKDGQVLSERGFGYADIAARRRVDPATTLFRPGSISKTFTWTAVMQLVQAGKIDLDADVNRYIDFKIPPKFGKPITMRNLMTHTSGFEEAAKYLIEANFANKPTIGEYLKRWTPERIYAPGSLPAYSNWGATLAGYVVERVSGQTFDDYVDAHIFNPLGMAHSTFRQPLPSALAPLIATGYPQASQPGRPFEIVVPAPAGALSATGDDMAKFMIAHLSNGGVLLSPATARQMYLAANTPIPGMPPMALGFYHEDQGGLNIIGHAGDTNFQHADMHLLLDKGVGVFMAFNSAGKDGSVHMVRTRLFDGFLARYFPPTGTVQPAVATAHAHGAAMAGTYVSSRGSETNFLRMFNMIGGAKVVLNADDTITVSALLDPAGVPKRWREIGPWVWREVGGTDLMGAKVSNGRILYFAPAAFAPIIEFVPAPADMNVSWIGPVAIAAITVMLIVALSWPVVALVRRGYGYRPDLGMRDWRLYRGARVTAWLFLAIGIGWVLLVSVISKDVGALNGSLDWAMRVLQLLLVLTMVGTAVTLWNALATLRRPGRHLVSSVWSVIVALAAMFLVWLALDMRLLTATLDF